eukprot:1161009-Pelagomonas_calceolata.AAC.10
MFPPDFWTLKACLEQLLVCERTLADKKGGHLCKRKSDGKLVLREQAMCPDADKGAFEDVSRCGHLRMWMMRGVDGEVVGENPSLEARSFFLSLDDEVSGWPRGVFLPSG